MADDRIGHDRRAVMRTAALLSLGLITPGRARAEAPRPSAIVETASGKAQGYVTDGVSTYKGIPYGADTSGRNRFLTPRPPVPWVGVRNALAFGPTAPQVGAGAMSEDCLVLNVWTPGPTRSVQRPVMVHLHGGGFYGGSAGSPQLDGANLARFGDVVVVTLNHRLGLFGHLHLRDAGAPDAFRDSGAVGMLDIVAALQWVRNNIAAFGGDSARVLVFGQSGGGRKVSVLMGMPDAKGLFHRAGIMSGALPRVKEAASAAQVTDGLLKSIGLAGARVRDLQGLPMSTLVAAQRELEAADRAAGEAPRVFTPVIGGPALPHHPFDPEASALSRDVPMISSTTLDERSYRRADYDLDLAGLRTVAASRAGENRASQAVALYQEDDPRATPYLLAARLDTDADHRLRSTRILEAKARQKGAAAYSYLWCRPTPRFGGRGGAPHGMDVGPSLRNADQQLNGVTPIDRKLMDQISSRWVAFAATGDPNTGVYPAWEPYTLERRATLIYDGTARVELDPRKAFREFWADYPLPAREA